VRTLRRTAQRTVAAKILAAVGAAFLVAGFALASLFPPFTSLSQLLMMLDDKWLLAVDHIERTGVSLFLWTNIVVPLLMRPGWLVPTMLGLVFVGGAVSFAWSDRKR